MKEKVLAILTSIVMVTAMAPVFSFAAEGDENEVTETPEMTQPVETGEDAETTEPMENNEVVELEEVGEPETQADKEEQGLLFDAKATGDELEPPLAPVHPGAARQENVGQYSSSMRIYGIYLKKRDGSASINDAYGDAVLIESNGKYLLMDTGSNSLGQGAGSNPSNIVNVLGQIGVRELDVYISHMHGDHIGGLNDVCKAFEVNKIYLPDIALCRDYETPNTETPIQNIYNDQVRIANAEDAEVVYLAPSFREHTADNTYSYFTVGAVQCSVIGPVCHHAFGEFDRPLDYLNNCSLVTTLTCGNFRYFSAGDAAKVEETDLVNYYGVKLDSDMFKLNHHGISGPAVSNTDALLKCVTPMWSFAENHGYNNPGAISRAQDYGYVYKVASNKHTFIADIIDGRTRIFIDSNNNSKADEYPLTGWVAVKKKYQFYDWQGYIQLGWNDVSGNKYFMNTSNGFRVTGTHMIYGVKCTFDKYGKLTDPKKPGKTKATSIKAKKKNHKITVKWKKAKNASGYQVFRSTSKKSGYVLVSTRSKKSKSYTNSGLKKGKTYYYRVRAVRYIAGTTLYGPFSKTKKIKAK